MSQTFAIENDRLNAKSTNKEDLGSGGSGQLPIKMAKEFLLGRRPITNPVLVGLHQALVDPGLVGRLVAAHKRGAKLGSGISDVSSLGTLIRHPKFDWGGHKAQPLHDAAGASTHGTHEPAAHEQSTHEQHAAYHFARIDNYNRQSVHDTQDERPDLALNDGKRTITTFTVKKSTNVLDGDLDPNPEERRGYLDQGARVHVNVCNIRNGYVLVWSDGDKGTPGAGWILADDLVEGNSLHYWKEEGKDRHKKRVLEEHLSAAGAIEEGMKKDDISWLPEKVPSEKGVKKYRFRPSTAAISQPHDPYIGPNVKSTTANELSSYEGESISGSPQTKLDAYNVCLNLPKANTAMVADDVAVTNDHFYGFVTCAVPTFGPPAPGGAKEEGSVEFVYGYINNNPERRGWTLLKNLEPFSEGSHTPGGASKRGSKGSVR